jgi:hypothetical protein
MAGRGEAASSAADAAQGSAGCGGWSHRRRNVPGSLRPSLIRRLGELSERTAAGRLRTQSALGAIWAPSPTGRQLRCHSQDLFMAQLGQLRAGLHTGSTDRHALGHAPNIFAVISAAFADVGAHGGKSVVELAFARHRVAGESADGSAVQHQADVLGPSMFTTHFGQCTVAIDRQMAWQCCSVLIASFACLLNWFINFSAIFQSAPGALWPARSILSRRYRSASRGKDSPSTAQRN